MSAADRDIERLSAVFKQGPLREWPVEDIAKDKIMRFAETYLMMARIGYRPAAPSDGLGNIQLSREQFWMKSGCIEKPPIRAEIQPRRWPLVPDRLLQLQHQPRICSVDRGCAASRKR